MCIVGAHGASDTKDLTAIMGLRQGATALAVFKAVMQHRMRCDALNYMRRSGTNTQNEALGLLTCRHDEYTEIMCVHRSWALIHRSRA